MDICTVIMFIHFSYEHLHNEDFEILNRWLQIVDDETTIKINSEKRKFRFKY